MRRAETMNGYMAFVITEEELKKTGSPCICDNCGHHTADGFLIPVLNQYLCQSCFDKWNTPRQPSISDLPMEKKVASKFILAFGLDEDDR